jgi:parallel beta-helix repeat protein
MKGQSFLTLGFVIILLGVLGLAIRVQVVEAFGTVYIRADGSIDPPTTPISSLDNITYVFTANINDSIEVQRSNIAIDGNEYTLKKFDGTGFNISGVENVTIGNVNIESFQYGFYLYYASHCMLSGNNITDTDYGIVLEDCSVNTVSQNKIEAIRLRGISLRLSSGNNLTSNSLVGSDEGIHLDYNCYNNLVSHNNITSARLTGIVLTVSSSNNTLSENNIASCNRDGIVISESDYNNVTGNLIMNNYEGILVGDYSSGNIFSGNVIKENSRYGISFFSSSYNFIWGNSFEDNNLNVYVDHSSNVWDNGYPSGGNYWSDYTGTDEYGGPYQNETGADGFWDNPYIIDGENADKYPIVPEFPSFLILPLFMTATLIAIIVYRKKERS